MLLYKDELPLRDILDRPQSTAWASAVGLTTPEGDSQLFQDSSSLSRRLAQNAKAALDNFDLFYIKSILVSVGWNKNDDVFEPLEVYNARNTPAHKPINLEHDCANIIGHLTTNTLLGEDSTPLADVMIAEDVPQKFHIVTGGVLYREWDKPELKERMDKIVGELQGESPSWFVSMEALFSDFDYAIYDDKTKAAQIIARNQQTAFLTRKLRAYGGDGQWEGKRLGRVLRHITFSGKGLVRNPANPQSIIFPSSAKALAGLVETPSFLCGKNNPRVFPINKENKGAPLVNELDELKQTNASLAKKVEELQKALAEESTRQQKANADALVAQKAELEKNWAATKSQLEEVTKSLAEAQTSTKSLADELGKAKDSLSKSEAELSALKLASQHKERVALAKTELGLDETSAEKFVGNLKSLADDTFKEQIAAVKSLKQTPAPLPPQQTNLPCPNNPPVKKVKGEETNPANLDTAKPEPSPALNVVDTEAEDLAKVVASLME